VCAQAQPDANSKSKSQKNPAPAQAPPQNSNQFPEDESTVPVLPSKSAPEVPPGSFDGTADGRAVLPAGDVDPVQSPDEGAAAGAEQGSGSSSSLSGIDSLMPGPDDEPTGKHGRKGEDVVPEHHETAAEDENVAKYYLDSKNWHAALSRYQSAMVLDPENPDVYWGLAESARHLGDYGSARGYYLKVMEYDPGSRHAKDAQKALKEPEFANAKPASGAQTSGKSPQ
jgi:tetratricopeptide (TPR) repeat protein